MALHSHFRALGAIKEILWPTLSENLNGGARASRQTLLPSILQSHVGSGLSVGETPTEATETVALPPAT
jgi:hypothetical protein